jgi:sigma-B regulation protein RsbU (phosphoserine phosphatase)
LSDASPSIFQDELEELQDLFDNAPCGYLSVGRDGGIGRANLTLAGWLGVEAESLLGKRFHDLLTIGGKMFYETHFAPMLRMQGAFSEVALELACADGSKLPVLVNAIERRDGAGAPRFVRYTIFNASERRRYERNLLEAKASAEGVARKEHETAELREQFIAVLGHDLRNPLASLAGGLSILKREELSERGRMAVQLMEGSIARGTALINDVLDLARARLGGGIAVAIDTRQPLAPVIEHVVAECRAGAPDKAIETEIDLQREVAIDRGRIGQLISNLVANAVTHGAPEQPIRLTASAREDLFEVSVANAGKPISKAAMARLFQPFFRGTVRKNQQGLGLGLYIASEIAKAHGGTLTVTSTSAETRFTFAMPLEPIEPE